MTRYKKCDYCKEPRKDIKRYKSGYITKFGENLRTGHYEGGVAKVEKSKIVYNLCDMCIEFLVPEEHRRENIISVDFINETEEIWNTGKRPIKVRAHRQTIPTEQTKKSID